MSNTPRFVHVNTKDGYVQNKELGNIKPQDLVFIKESNEIVAKDDDFTFVQWNLLYDCAVVTEDGFEFHAKDSLFLYK